MSLPIDDEHAAIYSVGQVAAMLDVQAPFLRRLDVEGVVQPGRSDGGQRRYCRDEIVRVQRVADLMGEGVSLVGVRRLLELEHEVRTLRTELARERARAGGRAHVGRVGLEPTTDGL